MAGLVADDWKAIRDRMEQIRAERMGVQPVCHRCGDTGWVSHHFYSRGIPDRICDVCRNPKGLRGPNGQTPSWLPRAGG